MEETTTKTANGQNITVIEDTREEITDFLDMAQEIESLEEEEQQKKLEEIFGPQEEQEDSEEENSEEEQKEEELTEEEEKLKSRQTSRANSDVVLAMQISEQMAAESMVENPCYVVHGAKMICSMGSREARLVLPLDHGVFLKDKPQMLATDYEALTNVMCFGNCFSTENPDMEQAAIKATNQYNETRRKGLFETIKGWFGVKPKEVTSVSEELKALCICECKPKFPQVDWTEGNEKSQIEEKNTLIQSGVLVCDYGGIIKIVNNGQTD